MVIVGFPRGIKVGVTNEINALWGTAELRGYAQLDDEGCLSFEVVGDKDMAAECYVEVEFNKGNS